MNLKPHKLRLLSTLIFRVAMLPFWPLPVAKLLARASCRIYYTLSK